MAKIFWIDTPIEFEYRDYGEVIKSHTRPGWFYGRDDEEDYWINPYEGHKKEFPHFEISIGDKLLTRNGSIMNVGPRSFSDNPNRPIEAHFSFFKDAVRNRDGDGSHEGTLTYYDKYLNHRDGNHIDKISGYDIVGPYDDKDDKCPCCKRRYDGLKD